MSADRERPVSEKIALSVEAVFRNHRVIMLLTDARTGAVLDANLTAQHVYGYSQLEFQTKTMPEIRAASSRQLQDAREKAARDPGSPSIMPHRLANGEIRWMEEYTTEFPLGESTGLFSIFVDITERRALETAHLQNEESARLRVEEALRLSEEKFFQAFKINPDSININRFADGEYVDINDGFTAMTGYTREDVLGRSSLPGDLGIWVNREDRERMLTLLQSQGEVIGLEAPFRRKDGTVLIGSLSARILEIKGERCILTITRDLTQRIRQEKALQERERNYREIFNSTSDGLGILDEMGTLIDANEQLCALFGVVRPETINRSLGEFIHGEPPFSLAEAEAYLHLAQTAGPQAFSWKFGDMSGNIGWVEVVLKACEINGQKRLIAAVRNITDRKNNEDLRRTYAEYQQALLDNFPFLVWLKDEKSRFLAVNKPFALACGLGTPEAVAGKTDLDVWPTERAESYRADDQAVLASGQPRTVEEVIEQAGKPSTWFETYKSPVQVNDRLVGTVGFSRDITERQRLLEAAQRSQKLESLSVLAGGIAHDFNNFLGGLFGCLDLARNASRDPQVTEYLDSALGAMERARALTHQLLTFAKGGAPVRQVQPLGAFLEETSHFALSGSNVTCHLEMASDVAAVEFDRNQLGQVVDNILINAQQAMPAGGQVRISVQNVVLTQPEHVTLLPGDYVRLAFADQGFGIPQEILSRIFDPFFTTKPKGSGLGLATCYSIISQHGGGIEVKSEVGSGSTFYVYLPVYRGAAAAEPQTAARTRHRPGKILFTDDEAVIRNVVYDMLSRLGHVCVCAVSGEEAISLFDQAQQAGQPFDAVILDLTIPGGMGGKETAALIRSRHASIPLIVSSGYAEDPVIAAPGDYGFTGSLRKPYTMSELAKVLDAAFR